MEPRVTSCKNPYFYIKIKLISESATIRLLIKCIRPKALQFQVIFVFLFYKQADILVVVRGLLNNIQNDVKKISPST